MTHDDVIRYCVVRLGGQSRKTKLLLKVDKEPVWDESIYLDLVGTDHLASLMTSS